MGMKQQKQQGLWGLFACTLVLLAIILIGDFGLSPTADPLPGIGAVTQGILDVRGYQKDDPRMLTLNGKWEYYPGQLICSQVHIQEESTLVFVPHFQATSHEQVASYRIEIQNQRENASIMVAFPGLMCEYRIYVDGVRREVYSKAPNFLQFVVLNGAGNHELVIELEGTQGVALNICPIAMDVNNLFRWIFGMRSAHLTFLGVLIFAFACFPLIYARKHIVTPELKPYLITGVLVLLFFIGQTIWVYGILDLVQLIIPMHLAPFLHTALETGMMLTMLWTVQVACPVAVSHPTARGMGAGLATLGVGSMLFRWLGYSAVSGLLILVALVACTLYLLLVVILAVRRRAPVPLAYVGGDLALLVGLAVSNFDPYSHVCFPQRYILPLCMGLFLLYWNIAVARQRKKEIILLQNALALEQRMAKTQAAFLASQIQPHFLYNALNTIQELCYTDPKLAAETVVHFSKYLRNNIDFMDYKDKIPFRRELAHIENYIQLQRTRFGDLVTFQITVKFEDFSLPPLTVQPLVENAVRHGVRQRPNGSGTVNIFVERRQRWVYIRIRDDGVGFDLSQIHSRSLENIRYRLQSIAAGTLTIESVEEQGTVATIQLPIEEEKPDENRSH